MDGATTIRELTLEEIALVSGAAWTWGGLATAMITGAVIGGIAAAPTGAGIGVGAVGGALLGGAGYLISGMLIDCF